MSGVCKQVPRFTDRHTESQGTTDAHYGPTKLDAALGKPEVTGSIPVRSTTD